MPSFKFYVVDDEELYFWDAVDLDTAIAEICEDFEINKDDIEAIKEE